MMSGDHLLAKLLQPTGRVDRSGLGRRVLRLAKASHAFRAPSLPVFLLILIFVAWGVSNKLSRYNPHPTLASTASQTKVWDRHQEFNHELLTSATDAGLAAVLAAAGIALAEKEPGQRSPLSFETAIPFASVFKANTPLRSPPFYNL